MRFNALKIKGLPPQYFYRFMLFGYLLFAIFMTLGCKHNPLENSKDEPAITNTTPNIIFLLSDDQRFDALGVAGNPILKTHYLDSLANKGVYFINACATSSVCCISRASILSGQYARRHKIWDFSTNFTNAAFDETFPILLKKAGYNIGFIGKFGVGENAPKEKFDYWRGYNGQGEYMVKDAQGKPIHILKQTEQQITEFINQYANRPSPFFLQVSFKSPHAQDENTAGEEYVTDPAYIKFYNNIQWQLPEAAQPAYFNYFPKVFITDNEGRKRWQKRFSSPYLINKSMQGYYRLAHQMDDVIGNLLAQLKVKKLDKNTIIIFASDNGYYMGEYGLADKWYGSNASIRIPLFVYDPRHTGPQGIKNSTLALNIDIAPTILSYANVPIPTTMQGHSLTELDKKGEREDFFYEHLWLYNHVYIPSTEGVVGKQYKYMRYFKGLDSTHLIFEELYDLKTDPNEIHNLIEQAQWKTLEDSLKERLWVLKKMAR
jgi:arylsulfatase A-like enzyme